MEVSFLSNGSDKPKSSEIADRVECAGGHDKRLDWWHVGHNRRLPSLVHNTATAAKLGANTKKGCATAPNRQGGGARDEGATVRGQHT